jgi:hypothetical protein
MTKSKSKKRIDVQNIADASFVKFLVAAKTTGLNKEVARFSVMMTQKEETVFVLLSFLRFVCCGRYYKHIEDPVIEKSTKTMLLSDELFTIMIKIT